jgi:hypothetical protein
LYTPTLSPFSFNVPLCSVYLSVQLAGSLYSSL